MIQFRFKFVVFGLIYCLSFSTFFQSGLVFGIGVPAVSSASFEEVLAQDRRVPRSFAELGTMVEKNGLIWSAAPERVMSFSEAKNFCVSLGAGVRVPSSYEYFDLIANHGGELLNNTHGDTFWTSTLWDFEQQLAFVFYNGRSSLSNGQGVGGFNYQRHVDEHFSVLCVLSDPNLRNPYITQIRVDSPDRRVRDLAYQLQQGHPHFFNGGGKNGFLYLIQDPSGVVLPFILGDSSGPVLKYSHEQAIEYSNRVGERLPTIEQLNALTRAMTQNGEFNKYAIAGLGLDVFWSSSPRSVFAVQRGGVTSLPDADRGRSFRSVRFVLGVSESNIEG